MKPSELRKKTTEELWVMKKDLEMGLIKASSAWGLEKLSKKEGGVAAKAVTSPGSKTSLQKNIRRNIARVLTIINEKKNISK